MPSCRSATSNACSRLCRALESFSLSKSIRSGLGTKPDCQRAGGMASPPKGQSPWADAGGWLSRRSERRRRDRGGSCVRKGDLREAGCRG